MRHSKKLLLSCAISAALLSLRTAHSAVVPDRGQYCNAVQHNFGFIRYPLGTIGVWSTEMGDFADVMTRAPRIYPCLESVVLRASTDEWRASVTGDPSILEINYKAEKPCGASSAAITVSPHVSVFKITFPAGAKKRYVVLDFGKMKVDSWAALNRWSERSVTRIDSRTIQATVGEKGGEHAYYVVKFSAPCVAAGSIDAQGVITDGAESANGEQPALYAQFDAATVTVAVAESFSSLKKADEFLAVEYKDFDAVRQDCQTAWNQVLGRVEMEGDENSKRMAYTSLYTIYANIIDGADGSVYAKYYPRPRSLASSVKWQFIGGFQSCCWDNFRAAYPFLMLAYPEVMTDVVNTYFARYQRNGVVDGNICLFTGPTRDHTNVKFSPMLIAEACCYGIQADYAKLYAALNDNVNNPALVPGDFSKLGYLTQPATGGMACSDTLEYATTMSAMALLAKANNDPEGATKYQRLGKNYTNVWDSTTQLFRVKNADGSWGVIENVKWTWLPNPQGLFEGTSRDWMFSIPHDPYGLIDLPGQANFVKRVSDYCLNDTWFNDNQYHYPYLLYYADAANKAQEIIRTSWVPLFHDAAIYEGINVKPPHKEWEYAHYTSTAGWLISSMLGLYPTVSPVGQLIITSPSFTKSVIHNGGHDITVEAPNNTGDNIYIESVTVDGKPYPCYMIPAKRLASGANIQLKMGNDPTRGLGDLYVASSDGFVRAAELVSPSHLRCDVEAPITTATTKIRCATKPVKVMVNGRENRDWNYDERAKVVTIATEGAAAMEFLLK